VVSLQPASGAQATKVKANVRAKIRVIAFDFYGTLVDLTAIARACTDITPNGDAFSATWRAKQLEYTFWLSLINRYTDFDRVTETALNFTLQHYGVRIDAVQREALISAWARPVAYPEVPLAVSKLAAHYDLVVLSNGTARSLADGLAHLGLGGYFRRVLSVDAVRVYKPAPPVYQLVLEQCQVTRAEVLFVSSNSFDVIGAVSFGFEVCRVNRSQLPLDPLGIEPGLSVADLADLTRVLDVA
jgi:2-haloacid dehalogenase